MIMLLLARFENEINKLKLKLKGIRKVFKNKHQLTIIHRRGGE